MNIRSLAVAFLCACASAGCAPYDGDRAGTDPTSTPTPSPDAAAVLYTGYLDGNADIWLRRGDGGVAVRLTDDPAQDHWADLSPVTGRIVFQTMRDGDREVYAMATDGSDQVNLTRHPADDLLPTWSPDGSRIAFFSTRGEPRGPNGEYMGNLWVMEADGSAPRRVTAHPLTSSFSPAWAPDGGSLVFTRDVGVLALHSVDIETRAESRITAGPESWMGARWSPDGARLAASMQVGDESRIVVMDADGAPARTLTTGGAHHYPTWSPDGLWIVFTAGPVGADRFDILAVSVDGGPSRPLVRSPADERFGTWVTPPGGAAP